MPQTLADGQLPTSAAAIYTCTAQLPAIPSVDVLAQNTSGSLTETVLLTLARAGGGTRRVARAVLAPNEQLFVQGLPLSPGDAVQGQTTDAATVDYTVFTGAGPFGIFTLDASGLPKSKTVAGIGAATNNFSAATDPGGGNDNTQGYAVGSVWINTTASRVWMCLSAATSAAVWLLGGVVPGVGVEPSSMLTYFGAGTGTFSEEGNLSRQISAAGVNPGATGADNVLAVYTLPASSFDAAGRGISITAQGSFAANGNTKRVKIIVNPATAVVGSTVGGGGTTVCDTGAVTTNGTGWSVQGNVFKYGANGSNTQLGLHQQAQIGAAVASMLAPSTIAATESGAILIAVTGNATTATGDIVFNFLEVNAMN